MFHFDLESKLSYIFKDNDILIHFFLSIFNLSFQSLLDHHISKKN